MNTRVIIKVPYAGDFEVKHVMAEYSRTLTGRWKAVRINESTVNLEFEYKQKITCEVWRPQWHWWSKKETYKYSKLGWAKEEDIDIIVESDIQECNHE